VTDQQPDTNRTPMTDDEIRASWMIEPPRLDGPITLVEYDPAWPAPSIRAVATNSGAPTAQQASRSFVWFLAPNRFDMAGSERTASDGAPPR